MIEDLILKNRSVRRFSQEAALSKQSLEWLVSLARLSASGANLQPLKYILSNSPQKNVKIFETLAWAGYLSDWTGPNADEAPVGYIVILNDTNIAKSCGCDHGIAAQSMLLGACEIGISGCMIGSIDRKKLRANLKIDSRYEIALVLALGKAKEVVVLEDAQDKEGIKYYRDDQDIHHVPKRLLEDLILDI